MSTLESTGMKGLCVVVATACVALMLATIAYGDDAPVLTPSADSMRPQANSQTHCDQSSVDFEECILLEQMISLVVTHNIAVLAGLAPFPPVAMPAEIAQHGTNLALKVIPPRLIPPNNLQVDPMSAAGPGYTVDGCGIEFELFSAQAEYANLFGVANFRDPYTRLKPFKIFPWRNFSNPADPNAETRWGFLRAPNLYHANTDVKLEIQTPYTLRKYDQTTDSFGEAYIPIETAAERPQQVYLPIGDHSIVWQATVEQNLLTDVAVPTVLLAAQVLSELKTAYGGTKAAKQAKKSGIGDEVADEALDPEGARRLSEGVRRFNDVWTKSFEDRQARKAATAAAKLRQKLQKKFRDNIKKLVKKTLKAIFKKIKKSGINSIDGGTRDDVKALVGGAVADVVGVVSSVYQSRYGTSGERGSSGEKSFPIQFVEDNLDDNLLTIIRQTIKECGPKCILDLLKVETAKSIKGQAITVWDSVPPTINIDPTPIFFEASDFGGTRLYRVRGQLLAMAEEVASDNCGRTPILSLNAPELLRIGEHQVVITARDRGPNPPNPDPDFYAPTAVQNIIVRDTTDPLLMAPPSKVILSTTDIALDAAEIGDAVAVDLADVQPLVINDAPDVFPVNSRTRILWNATDASGNDAESEQLITVKESNTRPTANGTSASTLTAKPVNITLTANDVDELDGRFDPLWFKMESLPQKGSFIAPLLPFFIEDYRTRPNDGLGQNFNPEEFPDPNPFVASTYCNSDSPVLFGEPPKNFVHKPLFVHVTDDGIRYVLDEFFVCGDENGKADTENRFSKWNSTNDFLGQMQIGSSPSDRPVGDAFRIDRDGFLYYNTLISAATNSARLDIIKCATDWTAQSDSSQCTESYAFNNFGRLDRDDSYARIDSDRNVIYVVAANRIFAIEALAGGGTRRLGEVGPKDAEGVVLEDWFGKIPSLEVGSDGALYANDVDWHRLHKIAPITIDAEGEFVLGEYVGWAGKCTASGFGDCEVDLVNPEQGRSFGYSCTYDNGNPTCTVAANSRAGSRQGQFDTPKYISIDPNDILYVADFDNGRVQRFSPDGSFAGEAVSEGSGINKGANDKPSFILGNMGNPESVAVNSSQFFVVDRDEKFVHVFGTLPFKELTDNEATVTYVSNQDFPNPNVIADDMFSFSVSDGLEDSDPAFVTVTVSRNFRPPQAGSITIKTSEDVPIDFTLPAGDPDGVIGKDPIGLDTLTYTLIRRPENGTLSGYADSWTYTPKPDFFGEDSLSFKVNDGLEDSNEGILTFKITPINDAPIVVTEVPERVALGFPLQYISSFTDDRIDEVTDGYEGTVSWGDGSSDTTGEFMNESGDAQTTGVVIIASPSPDLEGNAIAEHTYEQTGEREVAVCVTDADGLEGCDELTINVESLVVMGIAGIFYDEPLVEDDVTLQEILDGTSFTAEIMAVNGEPTVGAGQPANDVTLDLQLPPDIQVNDIGIDRGTCTRSGLQVSCAIGMLEPGAQVKLTLAAAGPGNLIYNEDRDFEGTLSTTSAALNSEIGLFTSIQIVADRTDSDGDGMSDTFETTFGLNPGIDDSAGDEDGDGLSNVDEYNQETSPHVADTDGDGLTDGEEVLSGTNPLFDDIGPELTIPPDIEVNATGALTLVNLGSANATDAKDGEVDIVASNPGPFRPGHNVVTWRAFDEAGNRTDGFQFVNVVPIVSFQVNQAVSEGAVAQARVELNGIAVNYPVTVPYVISGTAVNPEDHDVFSGEAVITHGLSADIEINVVKDLVDEPDETIVLTMGMPTNAVAGAIVSHTISVTETNLPPKVAIGVEQQGRATTTIVSGAGLIGIIADVRDDPAQEHLFDWSASDPALVDPIAVNDPAYLLEPSGLSAGLYDMRVSVLDDGVPTLDTQASSLLKVTNEQLVLLSGDDSDGDGESDAMEGPADGDGDRIANYLDDTANSNVMRLAADGRMLETAPGLNLRLGATAFGPSSAYASLKEDLVGTDIEYGYSSDLNDFEITNIDQGGNAVIVVPLANPVSTDAVYRSYANGRWQNLVEDSTNSITSAPGERGACPPPASTAYNSGLAVSDGCVQLTLTDGGPNDSDGVADGVVRIIGGLAAPVAARAEDIPQTDTVLAGDGEAIMVRMRLHSDSGDAILNSLELQASGGANDLLIDDVIVVYDTNRDGAWEDDDIVLSTGQFTVDDGTLTLAMIDPLELPVGDTDLLVIYVFGNTE